MVRMSTHGRSPAIVQGPDGAKVPEKWARPHFRLASVRRLALASAAGMAFANEEARAYLANLPPASVLVVLWLIGFFH